MAWSADCSAVLVATNVLKLPLLFVLLVIHSDHFGVFHNSAFDASYAMIVPESKLGARQRHDANDLVVVGHHLADIAATIVALPALLRQAEPLVRSRNCLMARRWRWPSTRSRSSSPRRR